MVGTGMVLLVLGFAFLSVSSGERVLISADHGLYITDTEQKTTTLLHKEESQISSIDYHYSKDYLYYTNSDCIMRRNMSSHSLEESLKIVTAETVFGIAVDWINNNIYWTNSHGNEIEMADLDGSQRKTIIGHDVFEQIVPNTTLLYDINVDPYEGVLFAIAGKDINYLHGIIVRSGLNGEGLRVLSDGEYKTIITFGIDYHEKRLYVTGMKDKWLFIYACDYNGTRVSSLNSLGTKTWVNPLRVFFDKLYMVFNYRPSVRFESDQLYRASLASYTSIDDIDMDHIDTSYLLHIDDMRVYEEKAQLSVDAFEIYQSERHSQPHPETTTETPHNNSCVGINETDSGDVRILVSADNAIYLLDKKAKANTMLIKEASVIRGLDYHYAKGYIYYIVYESLKQIRLFPNTTCEVTEINLERDVLEVAVDWVKNNIYYWANSEEYIGIERADLDGANRIVIVSSTDSEMQKHNVTTVLNLQVDPIQRLLFAIGRDERRDMQDLIIKVNLEGNKVTPILEFNKQRIASLAVDQYYRRLYTSGVEDSNIFVRSYDYDGTLVLELDKIQAHFLIRPMRVLRGKLYVNFNDPDKDRLFQIFLNDYLYHLVPLFSQPLKRIDDMKVFGRTSQMSEEDIKFDDANQITTPIQSTETYDERTEGKDIINTVTSKVSTEATPVTEDNETHKNSNTPEDKGITVGTTTSAIVKDQVEVISTKHSVSTVYYVAVFFVLVMIIGATVLLLKRYHIGNFQRLFQRNLLSSASRDSVELND